MGIELINEDEAETRLLASGDLDDEPDDDSVDEPADDDDAELTPEDLDEISRRIDDPVRMYLTQMGEIPLLTREQEIDLAKKIEITRKRFRRKVLECDYALRAGGRRAQEGQRRRAAVRPHREGVGHREPREGPDPRPDAAQPGDARPPDGVQRPRLPGLRPRARRRRPAGRSLANLKRRRRKAVNLVEELSIRTQKVQPLMKRLEQISARMGELRHPARGPPRRPRPARKTGPTCQKELKDLMRITLETPESLRKRGRADERPVPTSTSRPSASSPAATCGWSSRSPRSTATAASRSST